MRRVIIEFESTNKELELASSIILMNNVCGILSEVGCIVRKAEQHPVQDGAIQVPRIRKGAAE